MRNDKSRSKKSLFGWIPLLSLLLVTSSFAATESKGTATSDPAVIAEGKKIAFDRAKGNCLACHMIDGGVAYGNIAPPLIMMGVRYPDKNRLHSQIYDASVRNIETSMPLFGKHKILTEDELDKLVEFIWSL